MTPDDQRNAEEAITSCREVVQVWAGALTDECAAEFFAELSEWCADRAKEAMVR